MFTGIVQEIGTVRSLERRGGKAVVTVDAPRLPADVKNGDSIAVDGVCLTVTSHGSGAFAVDAVEETLTRSTLGELRSGDRVNLEYALRAGDRLGGHYVQGHVDGVGSIRSIEKREGSVLYEIRLPDGLEAFCIEKGSIAVDGISLTITALKERGVTISVIPHTLKETTLRYKEAGGRVNIEVDLIGKYVRRFLEGTEKKGGISEEFLRKTGFLE